jgi:hypothetical protein
MKKEQLAATVQDCGCCSVDDMDANVSNKIDRRYRYATAVK